MTLIILRFTLRCSHVDVINVNSEIHVHASKEYLDPCVKEILDVVIVGSINQYLGSYIEVILEIMQRSDTWVNMSKQYFGLYFKIILGRIG